MSDDLARLFAESAEYPSGEAFVGAVQARIARDRRLRLAWPFAVLLLLVIGIWLTWPAAFDFGTSAARAVGLILGGAGAFFDGPLGRLTVVGLLAAATFWVWLYERLKA